MLQRGDAGNSRQFSPVERVVAKSKKEIDQGGVVIT